MRFLARKVSGILRRRFRPPARVRMRDDGGVLGTVTSDEFRGLETLDRLNLVWHELEGRLTAEEKRRIDLIVPQTTRQAAADNGAE